MNLMYLIKATAKIVAAGAVLASTAQAQTVYRIVGADGRVTFSDKPPLSVDQGKIAATGVGSAAVTSGAALPFELRQVATRYPVNLYTAPDCAPCGAGRTMLLSRGIPFTERSVTSVEDSAALKRLSGETSLPFLSIGGQRIKGFSETEWTQYLDAAGYPKTSMLPLGYRQASALPLVSVDRAAATRAEERPEARTEPTPAPAPAPANPAGIQF